MGTREQRLAWLLVLTTCQNIGMELVRGCSSRSQNDEKNNVNASSKYADTKELPAIANKTVLGQRRTWLGDATHLHVTLTCNEGFDQMGTWCMKLSDREVSGTDYKRYVSCQAWNSSLDKSHFYPITDRKFHSEYQRALAFLKKKEAPSGLVLIEGRVWDNHNKLQATPSISESWQCFWHSCECHSLITESGHFRRQPCSTKDRAICAFQFAWWLCCVICVQSRLDQETLTVNMFSRFLISFEHFQLFWGSPHAHEFEKITSYLAGYFISTLPLLESTRLRPAVFPGFPFWHAQNHDSFELLKIWSQSDPDDMRPRVSLPNVASAPIKRPGCSQIPFPYSPPQPPTVGIVSPAVNLATPEK